MYNIHIMLYLFYFTLMMGYNYFISTYMTHELRLIKKSRHFIVLYHIHLQYI